MKTRIVALTVVLVPALLILLPIHGLLQAEGVWYVAPDGDDGSGCLSPATSCRTINGGIEKASPGDTILIASGVYTATAGDEVVHIDKDIILSGGYDQDFISKGGQSIIDGEKDRRGIYVARYMKAAMDHFDIRNGNSNGPGGGIYVVGTLTVTNSTVQDNRANRGGGIFVSTSGNIKISESAIVNNSAGDEGGGIQFSGRSLRMINSTVAENYAYMGGGIHFEANTKKIVTSSTIAGNFASFSGGGVLGSTAISNTILADNEAVYGPDCLTMSSSVFVSAGYNLIEEPADCHYMPDTGDVIGDDPGLGELIGSPNSPSYYPLLSGSPAIDAGNPAGCTDDAGITLVTDQRGAPRVDRCDIGAYEYREPGPVVAIHTFAGNHQRTLPGHAFVIPFRALVVDELGTGLPDLQVIFSGPSNGVGGTFDDTGTYTTTAVTNESGIATASPFTANNLEGSYTVTATVSGVAEPAVFQLDHFGWYVSRAGLDSNDCLSPSTTCHTISGAMAKPGFLPGDTVLVTADTYTETANHQQLLLIEKDVNLLGGYDHGFRTRIGQTVLSGVDALEGVVVDLGVTALVERFTIQDCCKSEEWVVNQSVALENAGRLTVNRVHIRNNVHLGIENTDHMTLNQSAVTGNGSLTSNGGGIHSASGNLVINNSTVSDNLSNSESIRNYGSLSLNNSTVANNKGGGIRSLSTFHATLRNSIVSGNTLDSGRSQDCSEDTVLTSAGHNLVGVAECTINTVEGDMVGSPEAPIDAGLGTLIGTPAFLPLKSNSLAINAGNPAGCTDHLETPITRDQRGVPRLDRCDIGAVERFTLDGSRVSVSPSSAVGGHKVHYQITLMNTSDVELPGATILDALPGELTYVSGTLSASLGVVTMSDRVISWTGQVPAHGQVIISYKALVAETVRLGEEIVNAVQIGGEGWSFSLEASFLVDGRICGAEKYNENPVLSEGSMGDWDDGGVWGPTVIKHDGQYMMWYTGSSGSGPMQIGLATSDDGIHWDKSVSNPVLVPTASWESTGVGHPAVIFNGKFIMWYTGTDDNGVSQIGYATSFDGTTWEKRSLPVLQVGYESDWNSESVEQPTVVFRNGMYHLWYTGSDGMTARIGKAHSITGIGWFKDLPDPLLDIGPGGDWDWLHAYDPAAVVPVTTTSNYWLFYNGFTLPAATHIGFGEGAFAGSCDNRIPLLSTGEQDAFDAADVDNISVLADDSSYKAWYAGYDGQHWRIGLLNLSFCDAAGSVFLPNIIGSLTATCRPYYVETFIDPTSGWYVDSDENREYAYFDGTYRVVIKKPASGWGITAGAKAVKFRLAVDARRAGGTGSYGVRFAINNDWSRFYDIYLSDQYYSVWFHFGPSWTPIVYWTKSSAIHSGDAWNHIEVTRDGDRIKLAINGVQVADVVDTYHLELGRIGFVVSSAEGSTMDARFDNFALYSVSCD